MTTNLGVLTLGQTPRPDGLARDVQEVVGDRIRVIERGVLDGLSKKEIARLSPEPDEYRLITLLSDRTSVQIAKRLILDRLQAQITDLEENENVAATLLMCTGEFPLFDHSKPLLQPQASLYGVVAGTAGGGKVGALIPITAQYDQARQKWVDFGLPNAILADANPYCDDPISAVQSAASKVRDEGASVLFMDCFGYDNGMRAAAQDAFGGPVILARSMAARIVAEMIA